MNYREHCPLSSILRLTNMMSVLLCWTSERKKNINIKTKTCGSGLKFFEFFLKIKLFSVMVD